MFCVGWCKVVPLWAGVTWVTSTSCLLTISWTYASTCLLKPWQCCHVYSFSNFLIYDSFMHLKLFNQLQSTLFTSKWQHCQYWTVDQVRSGVTTPFTRPYPYLHTYSQFQLPYHMHCIQASPVQPLLACWMFFKFFLSSNPKSKAFRIYHMEHTSAQVPFLTVVMNILLPPVCRPIWQYIIRGNQVVNYSPTFWKLIPF